MREGSCRASCPHSCRLVVQEQRLRGNNRRRRPPTTHRLQLNKSIPAPRAPRSPGQLTARQQALEPAIHFCAPRILCAPGKPSALGPAGLRLWIMIGPRRRRVPIRGIVKRRFPSGKFRGQGGHAHHAMSPMTHGGNHPAALVSRWSLAGGPCSPFFRFPNLSSHCSPFQDSLSF